MLNFYMYLCASENKWPKTDGISDFTQEKKWPKSNICKGKQMASNIWNSYASGINFPKPGQYSRFFVYTWENEDPKQSGSSVYENIEATVNGQ